MNTAILCAAIILAASSVAIAHEKKPKVIANACAGLSIKAGSAAKLDYSPTGTTEASELPQRAHNGSDQRSVPTKRARLRGTVSALVGFAKQFAANTD
ncbi:hypothetical protein [Mesorhizobium sp. B2-4-6]|uniref:hypothetical protein n=1 Tax=Mesorhizobium sp. B2-4-6 TaxID=2589943 RepID=UPI001129D2E3|nr:hypothetical protein [Mesorhizobium sp. B2-4-6]TPL36030.1 hypothetical protein FJ957_29990 [Mesorhizobium sp. B2-4-6]